MKFNILHIIALLRFLKVTLIPLILCLAFILFASDKHYKLLFSSNRFEYPYNLILGISFLFLSILSLILIAIKIYKKIKHRNEKITEYSQ